MGKINRPKLNMLNCVKKMPPLKHISQENNYNIMDSEVCDWLLNNPEVREWIYRKITDSTGGKNAKFIKFNKETRKWQGVDYEN
jgi:hypothetical protein